MSTAVATVPKKKKRKQSKFTQVMKRLFQNPVATAGMIILIIMVLVSIFAPLLSPYGPSEMDWGATKQPPSAEHWFGTDVLGRDIFTRCLYGGRWSLTLGFIAAIFGVICGLTILISAWIPSRKVLKITPLEAYAHYRKVLTESPVEIFYVGSAPMEYVAQLLMPIFRQIPRDVKPLPPQTALNPAKPGHKSETMEIFQAKLAMGFVTPITNADPRFAAMQLFNTVFGAGMTSKLFVQLREKQSLCYAVGSGYYGSKGLLTVHAGIDSSRFRETKKAILEQLKACQNGDITAQELDAAKQAILSSLQAVYDSPGAMESFFSTSALSGLNRTPERYAEEISAATAADVVEAAKSVCFHSSFLLKGEQHE